MREYKTMSFFPRPTRPPPQKKKKIWKLEFQGINITLVGVFKLNKLTSVPMYSINFTIE